MDETLKLLMNHRSVREYDSNKNVSEEQVDTIVKAAMSAPNWINGQQVTVIEVRDNERKSTLAKAAGNQKYIEEAPVFLVFCIDFYRAKLAAEKHGKDLRVVEDMESILVGSTDVGIALGSAVVAAESMSLGTVPIGGIRRNSNTFVELLELPEYVFPVAGLLIGYPRTIPAQKPRLPQQATHMKERYDVQKQKEAIPKYDDTFASYMYERTNGKDASDWSTKVANFYEHGFEAYEKSTSPTLKKQGFRYK
ncbi:NADPH-dependent oxidoreductase [Salirhabdus sp. Marseille-P4669]|uniref:NADPH-dependent oxidoreductase n=1 Tax=Salirhabdus sp. Marseille-P4669 TaxID=2042310 RepID=UPI000C7E5F74|nr:NADPH-dependent oxidoreductase [Salirhabdus sp. Marseille-P4669]